MHVGGVAPDVERHGAGWPFALVARCRQLGHLVSGARTAKSVTASMPWYQCASGGMDQVTSSVSSATRASASPRSNAEENAVTVSRRRASPIFRSVCCWLGDGTFSATSLRARARAEFTDVVEVSIMAAISAAEKPRTSNSSSAAREADRSGRAARDPDRRRTNRPESRDDDGPDRHTVRAIVQAVARG
ncbi:hypothetical protein GCM10010193_08420 [Kitasatospora atroaurantiaca]